MRLNISGPVLRRTSLVLAAGAALVSLQARGADDEKTQAEGIIFERQQVMMQLGKDADALGKIAAGQVPPDRLAATTKAIADGARDSVEAFKQQVPGGHAKPEVWSNYADFTARMEKFAASADAMAKEGQTGNLGAVMGVMVEALPCKECHDLYREKKKS